jgi:uncharacterized SAM-binding protein YcdF (DUF218 family)
MLAKPSDTPSPHRDRVGRRSVWLLGAALVLAGAGFLALTARLLIWPRTDTPAHADAVVVLGSEVNGRLDEGLRLMDAGVADTLALSVGGDGDAPPQCSEPEPYRVICFNAVPFTTHGEAREIRSLAVSRGWRSIAVVTSSYHVARSRLLVGRCFGGRIEVIASPASFSPSVWVRRLVHEWGGLVYAWTLSRGC